MSRTSLFQWARSLKSKMFRTRRGRDSRPQSCRPRLELLEDRLALATFLVLNTNDSGADSLRQAILSANAAAGPDVITFNIGGGGVQTIAPTSPLPAITGDGDDRRHDPTGIRGLPAHRAKRRRRRVAFAGLRHHGGQQHRPRPGHQSLRWLRHPADDQRRQHDHWQLHRHRRGRYGVASQR